jgi:hypothetical protein
MLALIELQSAWDLCRRNVEWWQPPSTPHTLNVAIGCVEIISPTLWGHYAIFCSARHTCPGENRCCRFQQPFRVNVWVNAFLMPTKNIIGSMHFKEARYSRSHAPTFHQGASSWVFFTRLPAQTGVRPIRSRCRCISLRRVFRASPPGIDPVTRHDVERMNL